MVDSETIAATSRLYSEELYYSNGPTRKLYVSEESTDMFLRKAVGFPAVDELIS